MALKEYFSRLFSSKQEDEDLEEQPAESQPEVVEEAYVPALLEIPEDSAIEKLYHQWLQQSWNQPRPELRLEDPGVLPDGWIPKELERLKSAVTRAASARIIKAQPKAAKRDAEGEMQKPQLPDLDAQPWVFLSSDRLAAWLMAFPPVGDGTELGRDMLDACLKENELTFGVDEGLLDRLPSMEDRYFHLHLLAQGEPAVDGKDGRIVDFFARKEEMEIKADEFGNIDYTEISGVQNADKGDAICQLIPHTEGVPGTTVQGKEIPAKNGKKVSLPKGRNTEITEDGTKLIATQAGHVEFTGRTFQVKSVLDIAGNVDYSTGNINFLGDVHVHGDVCTGFTVRAVGSIRVDGVIEGTVEAGGDLVVGKGILGGHQSVIRAHRDIFAKYMENSCVHARKNLQADCIVNCDVYSDGFVQVNTGRGTIIGGKVSAGQGINAKIVGSKSESLTTVLLGGLPCAEYERGLLLQEIEELEASQKKLEMQPDGPVKLSRLSKTRMQISVNRMKLEKMDNDLAALQEALEGTGKARLECGIAYAGTEICINGKSLRLSQETHKCVARLSDDGEIRIF